jgi:hypothetical protein
MIHRNGCGSALMLKPRRAVRPLHGDNFSELKDIRDRAFTMARVDSAAWTKFRSHI